MWARNLDASRIETGAGLPNTQEIHTNLVGTASVTQKQLEDTLFGYQLVAGVDYALTDTLMLGIKGRWVDYDSLSERGGIHCAVMRLTCKPRNRQMGATGSL